MSTSPDFQVNLLFFGFELFAAGLFLSLSLDFSLPWFGQLLFALLAVFYSVVAWWAYQDIIELYEEQVRSKSSSEGREVIQVEVKP